LSVLQIASSEDEVRRYARGALVAAGLGDRVPVPVEEVAAAVNLRREDLFDLGGDAPPEILAIMRKLKGKVFGLLAVEERRYYIDTTVSTERQRFTEAHEIGHDALPWHRAAYFGEDKTTLAPDTRVGLEAEANLFSSEILFAGDRFNREADDYAPSLNVPLSLAGSFQTSAAATLRRYVWGSDRDLAIIVTGLRRGGDGSLPVFAELTCESPRFRAKYGAITDLLPARINTALYPSLSSVNPHRRGSVDPCEVVLSSRRGSIAFIAEGFANGYNGFILLYRKRRLDGNRRLDGKRLKLIT